jgi:hypothetical protein
MRSMNRPFAVVCAAGIPLALAAAASGQLILDGNMDALATGTAPDCAAASGAWQFPANYQTALLCEILATDFSIVATNSFQPAAVGNSLALDITDNANSLHLTNILPAPIAEVAGQIVRVEWQIWVQPTGGGGSVYVGADMGGGGFSNISDRGPQMAWQSDGAIVCNLNGVPTTVLPSYPRGVWQNVRCDIHLDTDTYDLYSAAVGNPLATLGTGLVFRVPTGLTMIDRFSVAHFGLTALQDVSKSFIDNVTITLIGGTPTTCYANCDNSTNPPCLNVNDFVCFNNLFAQGSSSANCDASTNPPILNVNDFVCYNNAFAARCGASGANDCAPRP